MGAFTERVAEWWERAWPALKRWANGFWPEDHKPPTTIPAVRPEPRLSSKWQTGQMSKDPSKTPTLRGGKRQHHGRPRPPKIER